MHEPVLYPAPRRLAIGSRTALRLADGFPVAGAPPGLLATVPALGAVDGGPEAQVRLAIDPSAVAEAGPEAYRLDAGAEGIRIAARTATGLRWGLATLVQLRRSCPGGIPCLRIDDAPAFAQRGFMLDLARDRVPSRETLLGLLDAMASLKYNHLQLYNEHAFAFAGHEEVWRAADPITPAEMRDLDAQAAARGIALTANQNTFGHFERWLRHPRYAPLGEMQGPYRHPGLDGRWLEPTTLCPLDPRGIALVEELLSQLFPCCSGGYANIGGDEPFDLGLGRSREVCARLGRRRVFSDHLGRILALTRRLGRRPQFWCDPHPNEDGSLPRDAVALVWGYGRHEDFASRLAAHADAGREVWVVPGTSNWNSYAGRTRERHGNLAAAAIQGRAHGAAGMLVTEWGDGGHRQQWPSTLLGLADGAQASWSGRDGFDGAAAGLQVLGSADLGAWLERLGSCEDPIPCVYDAPAFLDSTLPWSDPGGPGTVEAWEAVAAGFASTLATAPSGGPWIEDALLAGRLAQVAADRALARRRGGDGARGAILDRLPGLLHGYRRTWLQRSRYGGLEDSYARLKAILV